MVWFYVNAISRRLAAVGLRRAYRTAYSAVQLCLALNQLVMFAGCDERSCRCCPVWGGLKTTTSLWFKQSLQQLL